MSDYPEVVQAEEGKIVVERRGYWIGIIYATYPEFHGFLCSECGTITEKEYKYCPMCGMKMVV